MKEARSDHNSPYQPVWLQEWSEHFTPLRPLDLLPEQLFPQFAYPKRCFVPFPPQTLSPPDSSFWFLPSPLSPSFPPLCGCGYLLPRHPFSEPKVEEECRPRNSKVFSLCKPSRFFLWFVARGLGSEMFPLRKYSCCLGWSFLFHSKILIFPSYRPVHAKTLCYGYCYLLWGSKLTLFTCQMISTYSIK